LGKGRSAKEDPAINNNEAMKRPDNILIFVFE
jgi:hypothetical protein